MKKLLLLLLSICISSVLFAQSSDAALTTQANVIRNENSPGGNTKTRIADMFQAVINSKVSLVGSYSDPSFITHISWSKITSTPTTLSGYGITDAQVALVSGTNIKTINGVSVLGSGNISITSGVSSVTLTQPSAGFTLTNTGSSQTGAVTSTFALSNDLAALEGLSSTGFSVRTGSDAWSQRTLTGTSGQIDISNGSGVSGNPTFSISSTYTALFQPVDVGLTALAGLDVVGNANKKITIDGSGNFVASAQLSNPATTNGDIIYFDGTVFQRIAIGSSGQMFTVSGGVPSWQNAASGFANPMTTAEDIIKGGSGGAATRLAIGSDGAILRVVSGSLGYGSINLASSVAVGSSILPVANGGTGTATPGLVAGTNVTVTGTWPNQTINSSGGGGGVSSIATTSPITGGTITTTGTIGINDAVADGTTKGAATFSASDFNSTGGLMSLDIANIIAASASNKGLLTSTDWNNFNNKQATGLSWLYTGTSQLLTGAVKVTGSATNTFTLEFPSLGATFTQGAGIHLNNPTAAISGTQQNAPYFTQYGQGFATGVSASQAVGVAYRMTPVQGSTVNLTHQMLYQLNGGSLTSFYQFSTSTSLTSMPGALTIGGLFTVTTGGGSFTGSVSSTGNITATQRMITGGWQPSLAAKVANYTVTTNDYSLTGDATSGSFTFSLPTASSATNSVFVFKKLDASANTITIDASGSETIDGALTIVLSNLNDRLQIQSNGTSWIITVSRSYAGSISQSGTATTVFTVTIGTTLASNTYKVAVTPTSSLSAAFYYVTNKTTTTFDVTYLTGLTGTVTFDWILVP